MKPSQFRYIVPTDVQSAVRARFDNEDTVVLAGGQSLVPTMNFRLSNPEVVIDLRQIEELDYIRVEDNTVRVGAMTRQRRLELDPLVHQANPLIRETVENIAHSVIRNRGTVGGSLAHADPSAELPCLLKTLRGQIVAQGPRGQRTISADDFFEFIFTTTLADDELLIEARFPTLGPTEGWAFEEFSRRHGDFAIAAVAATVVMNENGKLDSVRLGASGISTKPVILYDCEDLLRGARPSEELFAEAGAVAVRAVDVSDESEQSVRYRKHLLSGMVARALTKSVERSNKGAIK